MRPRSQDRRPEGHCRWKPQPGIERLLYTQPVLSRCRARLSRRGPSAPPAPLPWAGTLRPPGSGSCAWWAALALACLGRGSWEWRLQGLRGIPGPRHSQSVSPASVCRPMKWAWWGGVSAFNKPVCSRAVCSQIPRWPRKSLIHSLTHSLIDSADPAEASHPPAHAGGANSLPRPPGGSSGSCTAQGPAPSQPRPCPGRQPIPRFHSH